MEKEEPSIIKFEIPIMRYRFDFAQREEDDISSNPTVFRNITKDDIFNYYFIDLKVDKYMSGIFLNIPFETIFYYDQILDAAAEIIHSYCLQNLNKMRYTSLLTISKVTEIMVLNLDSSLWKYDVFNNKELLYILLSIDFIKWVNIIMDVFDHYKNSLMLITDNETCYYLVKKIKDEDEFCY